MCLLHLVLACAITAAPPATEKGGDTAAPDDTAGDTATACTNPVDWYGDADSDGFGTALYTTSACEQPEGYVANAEDCNDTDAAILPGGVETCDGVDQDCDGATDDGAADAIEWYADTDGDEYGDATNTTAACDVPEGYTSDSADCDDAAFGVHPGADESCNGEDDDCDTDVDEADAIDALTWYADTDGDGYGDPDNTTPACELPAGYLADDNDCDDTRADANPLADEVCNGVDDDCDALADDNPTDPATWYFDADADGYGRATTTVSACDQPPSYVATGDDCNDVDGDIHPSATDLCDTEDSDCDGEVAEDESADASTWYLDADGDTFGDAAIPKNACTIPTGYVSDNTDCEDADDAISPDDLEYCGGSDENCDGSTDESTAADATAYYADVDLDTYGDPDAVTMSCTVIAGAVTDASDCNDGDSVIHPAATDTCDDGVDQDCDGTVDGGCWTTGTRALTDADLIVEGASGGLGLGLSLAGVSDLTSDGVPDLITSVYGYSTAVYGYYVVSGTTTGTITADASTAHAETTNAAVYDIALGDADGDGNEDVFAVGTATAWLDTGPFSVGSSAAGTRSTLATVSGSGYSYSGAFSDLDGDGLSEIALGVPSDSGVYSGCVVWLFNNPVGSGHTGINSAYWPCGTASGAGYSMSGGHDVNGDGLDDLLIGNDAGPTGDGAYVIFGPSPGDGVLPSVADVTLSNGAYTQAGNAAALLADADGDGLSDVVLGGPEGGTYGAAYVFVGVTAGTIGVSTAVATISGTSAGTGLGYAVNGADIDRDGVTDLLLSYQYGDALQFFGPVSGALDGTDADTTFDRTAATSGDVANAGDMEGIGFEGALISDPGVNSSAGAVYLFYGAGS